MEKVLKVLLSKICLIYLNDVIVFGKTFKEMMDNLRKVFRTFQSENLKVNPSKCNIFERQVRYLEHVSSERIATDSEKNCCSKRVLVPKNKKQVRSFLEFCSYYRKFAKGFS